MLDPVYTDDILSLSFLICKMEITVVVHSLLIKTHRGQPCLGIQKSREGNIEWFSWGVVSSVEFWDNTPHSMTVAAAKPVTAHPVCK